MLAKIISLALLVAASAHPANYGNSYSQPQQEAPVQHDIDYKVKWEIKDEPTYNYQTRDESKYGDKVEGSYSLVDPDSTLRIVKYTADENGFVAHVEHKPLTFDTPKYESYSSYEAPQQSAPQQYQQSAPQESHYNQQSAPQESHYNQQSAPQESHYQQSSQSNYGSFQAAEPAGVTIFSAPPAPVQPRPQMTQFSAGGPPKPTFSQSSEVNFRPVMNTFQATQNSFKQQSFQQQDQSSYNNQQSDSKYH